MITGQINAAQLAEIQNAEFVVLEKQEEILEEKALHPHTTATLLKDAITVYGWSSSKVMEVAQLLFENGLITYPRTDSISISPEAADEARMIVKELFGANALDLAKSRNSHPDQNEGAHEAIRPTSSARYPQLLPEDVNEEMKQLYVLIWKRYLAWFMKPAKYMVITVELETNGGQ